MAICISEEKLLTLGEAAAALNVHKNTLARWHQRGVRGVKLDTLMVGGQRYTSGEAIQRFADRTTAAADGKPTPARTTKQRDLAIKRAEDELSSHGI